ncbi:unnamed protein product [Pieris macdunnoughi]|uniref:Uncharacterized protein n=1 Tax=Pieris macdunnoughi TaxID=345717 RepID=A0A821XZ87_9NEOP|nr:unnamed protein product [Pieris macdunnoughi]
MELFIPFSAVPVGGKSQPWFRRSCKAALRRKRECFKAWAEAVTSCDVTIGERKKAYNSASRSFKREIAKAKSEHIARFGEKLAHLPSGTRAFWSLAKAVQGNFCQPSIPPLHREDDSLAHTAKEKADLLGCSLCVELHFEREGTTDIIAQHSLLCGRQHWGYFLHWPGRYPSRAVVDEYRNKLVSEVETLLRGVSDWGRLNLVQFNPKKTQVCAFLPLKTLWSLLPFEDTLLKASASIGILGVDISNNVQFRGHLEGKAKLASSKSLVCSVRRDGTSLRATACNYIKRKFGPIWSTALTSGRSFPQLPAPSTDRIQRRAVRDRRRPVTFRAA